MARRARAALPSDGPLRLRSEVGRSLASLEREVDQALSHTVLSSEDIHDLHRDLRRVASGIAVWGLLLPTRHAASAREIEQRLRRLARLVGRVRDRDVTMALLAPAGHREPRTERQTDWHEFLGRLRDDTRTGRELLRAFLRAEREAGLFERARALLDLDPRLGASRDLVRLLAEERQRRQGRIRKAQRRARRHPTSERLHRLRIRIRQWRHLMSLEAVTRTALDRPSPSSWQRLQARLGRLHDLDVALATVPEELADAPPALRLKDTRRELRRSVRGSLERIASRPERPPDPPSRGAAR